MKKDIHPENYRLVVFQDMSNDYKFITKSTVETKDTIKWEDGNEYPLVKLEISHKSHPFYTGKMKLVDTAGRVDKFKSRYKKQVDKKNTPVEAKEEAPALEVKEEVKAEAPVEETPVEETTAVEEAPIAEETATEEAPVEEAPAEEASTEETPVAEALAEEAPEEDSTAEDTPADDSSKEEKSE